MTRRDGEGRPAWPTALVVLGTLGLVAFFVYSLGDRTDPSALDPPTPVPSTSPAATASPVPSESPSPTVTTPSPVPATQAPVSVLNQTAVPGLAARAAAVVEAADWEVATVDNTALGAPSTTLYVPAGLEQAGEAFSAAFPAVTRIVPAFEGLPPDELTLVLADPDAQAVVEALEADASPVLAAPALT